VYRALLVCNSIFPRDPAELPELRGPTQDGLVLWDALTDPRSGMFDRATTTVIFERSAHESLEAAGNFFGDASAGDVLLFYYSGHGRRFSNQLVLCGRDTSVNNLLATGVPARTLKEMMDNSSASVIVVLLDCCHGGAFKGTLPVDELAGTGRYIISASSSFGIADDSDQDGKPSPFTAALVDGLCGKAAVAGSSDIDLDDLFRYISKELPRKHPRPSQKFDGSGSTSIARVISRASIPHEYTVPREPSEPIVAAETRISRGPQILDWPGGFYKRTRHDLSYGDLRAWRMYALLGGAAFVFGWIGMLTLPVALDYSGPVSPYSSCTTAIVTGAVIALWSAVEGAIIRRSLGSAGSRTLVLKALQTGAARRVSNVGDGIMILTAILIVAQLFYGYTDDATAVFTTCLSIAVLMTAIRKARFGGAAFLAGTAMISVALFMPQSLSGYDMLTGLTGIGILQLVLTAAMGISWWFKAASPILAMLPLASAIPIFLAIATSGDLQVGPVVALCGSVAALAAVFLGDGRIVGEETSLTRSKLKLPNRNWLAQFVERHSDRDSEMPPTAMVDATSPD
jgi:Caspase domain